MTFLFLFRRKKQSFKPETLNQRAAKLFFWIGAIIVGHTAAMVAFENLSWFDSLWLTMTTVFTVGYGDLAAKTAEGRTATMVLAYAGGVFFLANLASLAIDISSEHKRKILLGNGRWNMKNHLVILGTPASDPDSFLSKLAGQLVGKSDGIVIVDRSYPNGLPDSLSEKGFVLVNGWGGDPESLEKASALSASAVLVLARNETDPASDSFSLDCVMRLREMGFKGRVVAECVKEYNRSRILSAGADETIRPVRAYPEMTARAVSSPGASLVFEELFDISGAELVRLELEFHDSTPWGEFCCQTVTSGKGMPCAYEPASGGRPVCAPRHTDTTPRKAVFIVR